MSNQLETFQFDVYNQINGEFIKTLVVEADMPWTGYTQAVDDWITGGGRPLHVDFFLIDQAGEDDIQVKGRAPWQN